MGKLKKINLRMTLLKPKHRIILASIGLGGVALFFMGHYFFIIIAVFFIPLSTFQVGSVYNRKRGIYRKYVAMCGLKKGKWHVLNPVNHILITEFKLPPALADISFNPKDMYQLMLICEDDQNLYLLVCNDLDSAITESAELAKRFGVEVINGLDMEDVNPALVLES
jgi:hypothetical protein